MIVERTVFPLGSEERNDDSNPEPNDSAESEALEETWEWDGTQWMKVS
jgi:hypothetical protein